MDETARLYEQIIKETRKYEGLADDKLKARAKAAVITLRLYMKKNGITKDAMAKKLGISRMQLFRWVSELNNPGKEMMEKMEEIGIIEKQK